MRKMQCLVILLPLIVLAGSKADLMKVQTVVNDGQYAGSTAPVYVAPRVQSKTTPAGTDFVGRIDTVGGTTYDWQVNGPSDQYVVVDPNYGVHVTWMYSSEMSGHSDRNMRYNFYDFSAEAWNFVDPADFMNSGVNAFVDRSGYGMLDVNPVTGVAYIVAHQGTTYPILARDAAPGAGVFEYCSGISNADQHLWPSMNLTQSEQAHVALSDNLSRQYLLYSKVNPWCTWSTPISIPNGQVPDPLFPTYVAKGSKTSGKVVITWVYLNTSSSLPDEGYYRQSTNSGSTWAAPVQIPIPPAFSPGSESTPSFHIGGIYPFLDHADNLHVVANIMPMIAGTAYILPSEIWHWYQPTNAWHEIVRAECDPAHLSGGVGYNATYACRPTLCEGADNELVAVWEQFDSMNVEPATGLLRADIHAARSVDNGITWGHAIRLTDPGSDSKRFPSAAQKMHHDTVYVRYEADQVAGAGIAPYAEGPITENPIIVQRFWKGALPPGSDYLDVGVTRIVSPAGTLDSGSVATPACSVYNFGTQTASYDVRMRIQGGYDVVTAVSEHAPGTGRYVAFQDWTAQPVGTLAVSCSTELSTDANPGNDKRSGSVRVRGAAEGDVGCTGLLSPTGDIDSGSVVTPACSVYNFGGQTVDYDVRMRVGDFYNQTTHVIGHSPDTELYVTFPQWTALPRGLLAVSCSTELAADADPTNDKAIGSVRVTVHDVGCTRIVAPTGAIDSLTMVVPACSVYNYGTATESYNVRLKIGSFYDQTAAVPAHGSGARVYVAFPAHSNWPRGSHAVTCSTELASDCVRANDRQTGSVTCRVVDMVLTGILRPLAIEEPGNIPVIVRVRNSGSVITDCRVRVTIIDSVGGDVYYQFRDFSGVTPSDSVQAQLPNWTVTVMGMYHARARVTAAGDVDPGNDSLMRYVTVTATGIEEPVTSLPLSFAFAGARPNPFGEQTALGYALPEEARVSLRVYSTAGKLLRVLRAALQPPGYYVVSWDGRDEQGRQLGRGVYFCCLTAGNQAARQKVMIVR
jgi:hypothetical protein